jgi:hypothetical protein
MGDWHYPDACINDTRDLLFNEKAYQSFLSGTRIYDPPNSLFSDRWVGQADMPLLSLWGYDKYQKIGNAHVGCLSQIAANRKCYGVKYGNVFFFTFI